MDWRRKQNGDNPDSLYLGAPLNGRNTYRLSGTRDSVRFIAFTVSESDARRRGVMQRFAGF